MEAYQEADFLAVLSRLYCPRTIRGQRCRRFSRRLARELRLPSAIEFDSVPGDEHQVALPLRHRSRPGTLLVPADLPEPTLQRLRERVVPQLETLLAVATEYKAMAEFARTSRDELHHLGRSRRVCGEWRCSSRPVRPRPMCSLGSSPRPPRCWTRTPPG